MPNKKDDTITPDAPEIASTVSYLQEAFALESEFGTGGDAFVEDTNQRTQVRLRRIELPQRTSAKHDGQTGKIAITPYKDQKDAEGNPVVTEYVEYMDILLVDALMFDIVSLSNGGGTQLMPMNAPDWIKGEIEASKEPRPVGGRTMWGFNSDGSRNQNSPAPSCKSDNGLNPLASFKGTDVFDPRTGRLEKIGYRFDEVTSKYFEVQHGCMGCPFAQWLPNGKVQAGKKGDAMCRKGFTYVVYDVDRKELMLISGANVGTHLALLGSRNNKIGHLHDDTVLNGIRYYFAWTETVDGEPRFRNRPEGKPSPKNPNAPVYAVRMSVSTNNFSPSTSIPVFTLLDGSSAEAPPYNTTPARMSNRVKTPRRALTQEEYGNYVYWSVGVYVKEAYRDVLMGLDRISHTSNFVPTAALTAGSDFTPSDIPRDDLNYDSSLV